MNDKLWWYLARAGGMVAALLLVAALVLGVLLTTRAMKSVDRPAWLLAMHRWLSTMTIVGTGLHIVGLVGDNFVHFGWREVLVPGASEWEPVAVGMGVVALYLMIAVYGTSIFMKKLPKPLWRHVHLASYALVWLAIVHAALAGTDVSNRVYQAVAMLLTLAAVMAALLRVMLGRPRAGNQAPRASRGGASARPAQRRPIPGAEGGEGASPASASDLITR